jgi:hypothetical protein
MGVGTPVMVRWEYVTAWTSPPRSRADLMRMPEVVLVSVSLWMLTL